MNLYEYLWENYKSTSFCSSRYEKSPIPCLTEERVGKWALG